MVQESGLEIYKKFSLITLPRSDFNSLDALECFKTKTRSSWDNLPPGPLQEK